MSAPAGSDRGGDLRIPGGKICAVAREQSHALASRRARMRKPSCLIS